MRIAITIVLNQVIILSTRLTMNTNFWVSSIIDLIVTCMKLIAIPTTETFVSIITAGLAHCIQLTTNFTIVH